MLFDTFLLFVTIILLSLTSLIILAIFQLDKNISIFLGWFVLSWAQIAIDIFLFSMFNMVKPETVFFWHLLLFSIVFLYTRLQKIPLPGVGVSLKKIIPEIKKFTSQRSERVVMILILFILATTFFTAYVAPTNNWDSMTYHMSRAAYWYQHGTINHYFTNNARQNVQPIIAETGILWTMLFAKTDRFANLIQWSSLIASSAALYGVCREFGFLRKISLLTTLTFLSLPMVIFQASTTQNDLVVAAFIMTAVYFTYRGLICDRFYLPYILLAGLSLGLAAGTKGYALFFLPGFLIFSLLTIFRSSEEEKTKKISIYAGFIITGILLFSTYNWVNNYQSYGDLFSDGDVMEIIKVKDPDITTLVSNIVRYMVSFFDLPITYVQNILYESVGFIHTMIGIDISSEKTTIGKYSVSQIILSQDTAYFGPFGFFLIWPSIIVTSFFSFIRYIRNQQMNIELYRITSLLVLSLSFFLVFCFFIIWQPYGGRFLIAFVLTSMPVVALVYNNIPHYPLLIRQVFWGAVIVAILSTSFSSLFLNYCTPILPVGFDKTAFSINGVEILPVTPTISMERTILAMNRTQMRFINYPSGYSIFQLVNQKIPESGRLGLLIGNDDWDYPYFGEHFERKIFQIPKDQLSNDGVAVVMQSMDLDGILVRKNMYSAKLQDGFQFYESGDFILFVPTI